MPGLCSAALFAEKQELLGPWRTTAAIKCHLPKFRYHFDGPRTTPMYYAWETCVRMEEILHLEITIVDSRRKSFPRRQHDFAPTNCILLSNYSPRLYAIFFL